MKPKLTDADYAAAARTLKTGLAEVKAVTQVESGGKGFLADGRPVIRFEPHIFHRYTDGVFDMTHPDISFPARRAGYPVSVEQSWKLFQKAASLKPNAAVLASSWGLFQIMGFQFSACRCKNLSEFVARMEESEGAQLDLFVKFIINTGLDDELRNHDWASFARQYNGKDYRSNKYDSRLAENYTRFSSV